MASWLSRGSGVQFLSSLSPGNYSVVCARGGKGEAQPGEIGAGTGGLFEVNGPTQIGKVINGVVKAFLAPGFRFAQNQDIIQVNKDEDILEQFNDMVATV